VIYKRAKFMSMCYCRKRRFITIYMMYQKQTVLSTQQLCYFGIMPIKMAKLKTSWQIRIQPPLLKYARMHAYIHACTPAPIRSCIYTYIHFV